MFSATDDSSEDEILKASQWANYTFLYPTV